MFSDSFKKTPNAELVTELTTFPDHMKNWEQDGFVIEKSNQACPFIRVDNL